jgi:hypothetical protein
MPKGKKNQYTCEKCGKTVTTLDVDEGTTPFMILCEATKGCKGVMYSSFYGCDQSQPHQLEWFAPTSLDGYSPDMLEHIRMGGLDLRKAGETKGLLDREV